MWESRGVDLKVIDGLIMHGYLSTPKGLTKRNVATSMQIECFPTTRKWFKVPPQKNEISGFAKIWLKSFKWFKNGRFRMNEFISKPIYNHSYIYAPGPATPPSPMGWVPYTGPI